MPASERLGLVPFSVQTQARGGRTVLSVTGEIDYRTAPRLEHEIARHSGFVIVDLNDATFIDFTGMKILIEARERLGGEDDGHLYVVAQHEPVRSMFEMTALTEVLNGDFNPD